MGGSLTVSKPPAMPESIWPSAIFIATEIAASSPVPQARCMSMPGVAGSRPDDNTHSRTRLKSFECLSTAPPVTSPSRSPAMRYLATSACSTAVNMSWLPTRA